MRICRRLSFPWASRPFSAYRFSSHRRNSAESSAFLKSASGRPGAAMTLVLELVVGGGQALQLLGSVLCAISIFLSLCAPSIDGSSHSSPRRRTWPARGRGRDGVHGGVERGAQKCSADGLESRAEVERNEEHRRVPPRPPPSPSLSNMPTRSASSP